MQGRQSLSAATLPTPRPHHEAKSICVDIENITFLTRDADDGSIDNNVETYCNILVERVKATASQRRKDLLREKRQRQQQQGTSSSSMGSLAQLSNVDDFDALQNSVTSTPFPDPRSVRISFLSLSESVNMSIGLIKRLIEVEDQFHDYVEENTNNVTPSSPLDSTCDSLSGSQENLSSPLNGVDEEEVAESQQLIFQLRIFVSWVCEITASALRRHLGLRTSDFHASSDQDLLEKEVLLLLVDGNLLLRREDALDALVDFRKEMQKTLGKEYRRRVAAEQKRIKDLEQQEAKGKSSGAAAAEAGGADKEEGSGSDEDEEDCEFDDDDLKVLQKSQELARQKPWQRGVLCTKDSPRNRGSGTGTPRQSPAYSFLSPTTNRPDGLFGAAKPSEGSFNDSNEDDGKNNHHDSTKDVQDAYNNRPFQDDDEEDVGDWSNGLGYLAPFITATWKDLEKQKKSGEQASLPENASFTALLKATDYQIIDRKLPSILFFEQELSRRQKMIQSASVASFMQYWLKGLRQHLFHSVVAFSASACVAGVSTPVVQLQQRLERKLDPASQRNDEEEECVDDENNNPVCTIKEESFKDWSISSVNILCTLVVLKSLLNVLLGVISSTLARVAASHRDEEKRHLTFAWTKMPLSTIHTLSPSRMREITCFPNDLEGLSVGLQRDIVSFGRAVVRCLAALGAVAMTSGLNKQLPSSSGRTNGESPPSSSSSAGLIPTFSRPPQMFGNNFLTRSITNSINWFVGTFLNTPLGWGQGAVIGIRSFTATSINFGKLLVSSQNGKEAFGIIKNHTSMIARAMRDSPRMRVVMFVSAITGGTAAGSWLFQKIKNSKAVKNFLKTKPDSETVATGGDLFVTLRRKGKVLLAPSEIVELMSPLLRLQHHSDTHLMKLWYDAVSQATSTFDTPQQHHHHHHHKQQKSFIKSFLWSAYHATASNVFTLSQSALRSVFSTLSDLSDWVIPLAAAAVYHRVLSKGLVSRFLILECLNSASSVVTNGHNLWETWETIELQSYKALIVSCMIHRPGGGGGSKHSSNAGTTETTGSPGNARKRRGSVVQSIVKNGKNESPVVSELKATTMAVEKTVEDALLQSSSVENLGNDTASHLVIKAVNAHDEATHAIVEFIEDQEGTPESGSSSDFAFGTSSSSDDKRLSLVVVDQDVETHRNRKKQLQAMEIAAASPLSRSGSSNRVLGAGGQEEELFTFAYPSRPNRTVLTLVPTRFEVPLNYRSIVAITGKSGSGKTTLLKLMLREYEAINRYRENMGTSSSNTNNSNTLSSLHQKAALPSTLGMRLTVNRERIEGGNGEIIQEAETLVHDSPLHNFAPEFLRSSLFSFVPQHCQLLPGSFNVCENISLSPCSAKDNSSSNLELVARVRNAAQLANAMDIIANLPEGLFTIVAPASAASSDSKGGGDDNKGGGSGGGGSSTENVIQLSGGQIQRIGIARALFQGSPVLLMDEPTASLDPTTKKDLLATLRKLVEENPVSQPSGCFEVKQQRDQQKHDDETTVDDETTTTTPNDEEDDDQASASSESSPLLSADENNSENDGKSPNEQQQRQRKQVTFDDLDSGSDNLGSPRNGKNQWYNFPHPRCVVYVTHDDDAVGAADVVVDLTEQKKNI